MFITRFSIAGSPGKVLASYLFSLWTMIVVAIALRALIRKNIGLEIAEVEEAALGNCVHSFWKPDEGLVPTVNVPRRGQKISSDVTVKVSDHLKKVLQMTEEEYERRISSATGYAGNSDDEIIWNVRRPGNRISEGPSRSHISSREDATSMEFANYD